METFTATLAMVGIVIIAASLLSALSERSGFPQVAVFLAIGGILGPIGLGLVDFTLTSTTLRVLATLGLVLVLFIDAISVDIGEVRRQKRLALTILAPGTLIPAAILAVIAWWLLDLNPAAAAIIGAALASTDPVLLRSLLKHRELPATARLALRLESGMNDVVLLPVVVVAMVLSGTADLGHGSASLGRHVVGLFVLGPGLGVIVGWFAITVLTKVRSRYGVRRDYESIYALGVALTAFAAAEAAGGSGFLAAFAAGLVIALLDVELCDCFLDYGEATAEMFLLLTFVAFGTSLIWTGFSAVDLRVALFAVAALSVRSLVLLVVLRGSVLDARSRHLVSWMGPRGLSSLLLVLLPVFAGYPGSDRLFSITALVVILSLVLHGAGIAFYLRRARAAPSSSHAIVSTGAVADSPAQTGGRVPALPVLVDGSGMSISEPLAERVTIEEMQAMQARGETVVVGDVRTERAFGDDPRRAAGAFRIPPDDAVGTADRLRLPRDATIVLFCA
jgi:sodium/hydrogen antiporter